MRTCGRSAQTAGPTPRTSRLASVPVARLGTLATTMISAEAMGTSRVSRAIPGAWAMSVAAGRSSAEDSSALAPARSTRTVSSRPAAASVASKPAAIACSATSTPTTPAIPTTTTEVAPSRSGTVARPIQAMASDWRPPWVRSSQPSSNTPNAIIRTGWPIQTAPTPAMASSGSRERDRRLRRFMAALGGEPVPVLQSGLSARPRHPRCSSASP